MAKIRREDIFDSQLFTKTTEEIRTMITVVGELQSKMLELMKVSKQALSVKPTSSEGVKKQAEAVNQVATADQNLIKLEKERIRLQNKLNQQGTKQAQTNAKLRVQTQERNKALKQQAREELKLVGAYEKQTKTLIKLRKQYKNLVVAGKGNTKQAIQLRRQVEKLDKSLKKVDASAGQYQRNVGNYGNKLKAGFGSIMGAVGLTAGITGAFRVVGNAVKSVKELEQAGANLASVLSATRKEGETWQESISKLTDDAKRLGGVTVFTAKEVTELQTSFARLGFSQREIIDVTESTLNAASALGSGLEEQAELTGSVIRAFNMDSSEAANVNDILAKSTTESALSFEKLATALPTVAPVANAVGVSLERTTSMLGKLVDSGLDASTASTGLRNVFLELQKQGLSLPEAMAKIRESTNKAKTSLELFGKRGATIGIVLEGNTAAIDTMTESMKNANGTTEEMAAIQRDTLQGSLTLLGSTWDAFINRINEAGSSFISLKGIILFVIDNFNTIVRVVKLTAIAFLSYKAAIVASNLAMKIYKVAMVTARIATIAFKFGIKGARRAVQALNTTIRANPIGLLVSGLTTAIALLWDFTDANDEAADSVDLVSEALDDFAEAQANAFKDIDDANKKLIANLDLQIAKAKERNAGEEELNKLLQQRVKAETGSLEDKIKLIEEQNDLLNIQARDGFIPGGNYTGDYGLMPISDNARFGDAGDPRKKDEAGYFTQKIVQEGGSGWDNSYWAIVADMTEAEKALERIRADALKEQSKILSQDDATLAANKEAAKEQLLINSKLLLDLETEIELAKLRGQTDKANNEARQKERDRNKKNNTRVIENKYLENVIRLTRKREDLERNVEKAIRDRLSLTKEEDLDSAMRVAEGYATDIDNVDSDRDGVVDADAELGLEGIAEAYQQIYYGQIEGAKELRKFQKLQAKRTFDDEKKRLAKQLKAGQLSQGEYDALVRKLAKNQDEELKEIEVNFTDFKKAQDKTRVKNTEDAQNDIKELAKTTAQEELEEQKKIDDLRLQELSQTIQATNALLDQLQRANDERTRRQIENIDKEIAASQKRFDELKKLSIEGNEDAEKSALTELRIQEELERKKQKLQRRQQLVNAGIAAFKVYGSKVEQGDEQPLKSTITDLTALTAFVAALPTFYEGTELVGESLGKPLLNGKDGHVVRVDSAERIVDPLNNSKLAGISNDELGMLGLSYKNNLNNTRFNRLNPTSYESIANQLTVNYQLKSELNELNRSNKQIISAIEHIPFESWNYDELSNAVIQKIKTQRKTEIKHYKNNTLF